MNRAIAQIHLKPIVDEAFTFDQAPQALQRMQSGAHFGKLVIRIS
jgi:NADPH:quinone reductase-like Zn-dependent oxidoreductase